MPLSQGIVTAPSTNSAPDGTSANVILGKQFEQVVTQLHAKYYTACYRGNMFVGATAAAGVVPPIYSNTAQTFMVWNPNGSGKNVVPVAINIGLVTVGVVTGNFVLGARTDAGGAIATGSTISAATLGTPYNMNLGYGKNCVAKFAPATATVLAPFLLMPLGLSVCMATTPTAMNDFWKLNYEFNGQLIVSPGTAIFVAKNVAGVATYNISIVWEEVPI